MTRQRNDTAGSTELGLWVRVQPELDSRIYKLDIQNLDYIVHRYQYAGYPNWRFVMLIEEKRFKSKPSFAQQDTHNIIHQALENSDRMTLSKTRGNPRLCYCGYHVLQFEKTSPVDGAMWWDGQLIDRDTLIKLLRFEVNPKNLMKVS